MSVADRGLDGLPAWLPTPPCRVYRLALAEPDRRWPADLRRLSGGRRRAAPACGVLVGGGRARSAGRRRPMGPGHVGPAAPASWRADVGPAPRLGAAHRPGRSADRILLRSRRFHPLARTGYADRKSVV